MSFHSSQLDEDDVAYKAFLAIQKDFYESSARNIPEFLPFKQTEKFDINISKYESPVLSMIIDAVRHVFREILQQQKPGQYIYDISCPSEELKRISWKVFSLLRLAPLRDRDSEGKTIQQYYQFRFADNFGEEGHLDMTHNRIVSVVNKQWAQERLEKLQNALMGMLEKRNTYLLELFSARETQEQENIMAHIERCAQDIHALKRDIHGLCHEFHLPNQLLPLEDEEGSSFSQAVHWNYVQQREKALEEFELSPSEKSLLPFTPQKFQEEEWPLFQFTFFPIEEIEHYDVSESHVFREDMRFLRERSLERKMMIGYYILHQLALHRRGSLTLAPKHVSFLNNAVEQLSIEIDLLRRKLMNKKGMQANMKHQLSEIDGLITSMQNVLQIQNLHKTFSEILEGIMGVMHTFYANCNQVYRDSITDPLEIESIIDTFRSDALERLEVYERQILDLETSSSLVEDKHFHRIVDMMRRSVSFLRGEK